MRLVNRQQLHFEKLEERRVPLARQCTEQQWRRVIQRIKRSWLLLSDIRVWLVNAGRCRNSLASKTRASPWHTAR